MATRWPRLDLGELWRFRELLGIFIWRDLKVRYKQTHIGAVWAIFQPAFTALVYTLIFGKFAKFPSGNLPYPIFAFSGVLAWQYFSSALNVASGSLLANVPLVTKVYFPRLLLPIAGVLVPLVDLVLASVVLTGMIIWFHTWPGRAIALAPLFILLALVTALGASLGLSALNVRYRDVAYAIPLFMQVLPFLSGVPYSLDGAPEKWQWLLSLNPLTAVVAGCALDDPRWAEAGARPVSSQRWSLDSCLRRRRRLLQAGPNGVSQTRSDGNCSQVEGLSKQYRIGQLQPAYGTLRDSLTHGLKRFRSGHLHDPPEMIWALRDVTFEAQEGEVIGIIGANGAGKTTLLKILTRITTPTEGRAEIRGRVGSLLEVGTGFHPELTGRENIYLNGAILGMPRRRSSGSSMQIVEFAGVERFIDTPVKHYSSGMYVRLAFSVAAHLEPEILIVDEVLSVGDADFQRRSIGRMESIGDSGRTVLFVSHNLQGIMQLCDRTILLAGGEIVREGPTHEVVSYYEEQTMGATAQIVWDDPLEAPGNDLVRLQSVRVVDEASESATTVDVRHPVGIEISFRVLKAGRPIVPKIKVLDQHGAICFNALDLDPRWHAPTSPGEYVATAWIPANLLNEGRHAIDVDIVTIATPKLIPHASTFQAVAFHVYDPADGDSARGLFTGQWRGVVRPILEWTCEEG